jgi:hypothetical protein
MRCPISKGQPETAFSGIFAIIPIILKDFN